MRKDAIRRDPALQHAIDVIGGPAIVARELEITVQAVSNWRKCPVRRAIAIERLTKGIVKRERLCPQVFYK